MKRIDRFILKSFVGPLVLTFFIVLFIQIMQFLWMYIDDMAGKGLEFKVLMELLFQFSLVFVPTALPLAIMMASIMTFGNMGENFELTAMKSSGVPLQRLMMPLMIFIGLITIGSFFFANNVLPYSNRKAKTLLYDIQRKRPELNIQAGTFYNGIEGFSIKIGSKDPVTSRLDKVLIYDHRDADGNRSVVVADSGYMIMTPDEAGLIFTLYNGYSYTDIKEDNRAIDERKYPFRRDYFSEQELVVELGGFDLNRSDMSLFKSNSSMLNMGMLNYFIDSLNKRSASRQASYSKEYVNSRLYSRRNTMQVNKKIDKDSTLVRKPVFKTDSLLGTLSDGEHEATITAALRNARNGSKFVKDKIETMHRDKKSLRKHEIEWHKKFTLAFACLVFFFIGAPLGAIIRKGGLGTPVVISVLFFVIYYVLSLTGEKMAKEGLTPTIAGMWGSTFILFPLGMFLTYKATTDSAIMNMETYTLFFKKIRSRLTGRKRAK